MSEITFYWHDYETYGLDKRLDRPAQFAGVRTDADLNLVGDPDVWYCDCAPDYLPNPQACLLTGLTPQLVHAKGAVCEASFASRINRVFRIPNTVSIGYNSRCFDDEVSRFLFWRNLEDPYAREWENGCSRWDLFPLVQAVWALRPEGIVWPEVVGADGRKRISFRLEKLTAANRLEHQHAHDAMSDVYATIALARLIREKNPRFWQWAFDNRSKKAIQNALMGSDGACAKPAVWIDAGAGQSRGFIRVAFPLWETKQHEIIVWDCMEDPTELLSLSAEEIRRRSWQRMGLADGEQPLPLFRLRPNKFPFICSNLNVLKKSACERFGINLDSVAHNVEKLQEMMPSLQGPISLSTEEISEPEKVDADCALYERFVSASDRAVIDRAASLNPETLAQATADGRIHFEDERLGELFWRKRARNWPETLTEAERIRWKAFCEVRLQGVVQGTRSLAEYFDLVDQAAAADCEALESAKLNEKQFEERQQILDDLYNWGEYVGSSAQQDAEGD